MAQRCDNVVAQRAQHVVTTCSARSYDHFLPSMAHTYNQWMIWAMGHMVWWSGGRYKFLTLKLSRDSMNAVPHYQKFYAQVIHIWYDRRGQPMQSAMQRPRPGRTLILADQGVSCARGKYAWKNEDPSIYIFKTYHPDEFKQWNSRKTYPSVLKVIGPRLLLHITLHFLYLLSHFKLIPTGTISYKSL